MADINHYASDLLLEFCDAAHSRLAERLEAHFGSDWLEQGIQKHVKADSFDRVLEMLRSPMRVVDMGKTEDELYGIEHIWRIVDGNWRIFQEDFGRANRNRTETYLGEITELRNNLAHRRRRHFLLRRDLIRIVGSCQMILNALRSPVADKFTEIVDSLSTGELPWGLPLDGNLPPSDEIYAEFVGRPSELTGLSKWLASDSPQILVWGYGGVGKSSLAHKFAKDVKDSGNSSLIAVCWVSAKQTEYLEGSARTRDADFSDLNSLVVSLWEALYGPQSQPGDLSPESLLVELQDMPILLVVDDFDTILEDVELTEFLLVRLRNNTPTRVIYTSRQRTPTVTNLVVPPFSDEELRSFVLQKALDYSVDAMECAARLDAIRSVTDGYPLFVGDLIRHASLVGLSEAINHWSQKKGDAARQYALQRQVEHLSRSSGEALISLSVANRALKLVEISQIAGLTDDDAEAGIRDLLNWRMVGQVKEDDSESPAYRMNRNTTRLVQQTFKDDHRMKTFQATFKALTGERVPEARKIAIGKVVRKATELVRQNAFGEAQRYVLENMTGELSESSDLYGVLGWIYSCQQPPGKVAAAAEDAFAMAHRLGSTKVDTYFHWSDFERKLAESMIENAADMAIPNETIAEQWEKCKEVAELGTERCGASQSLYYMMGYGASREAKAMNLANNFTYAEGAYRRSVAFFELALGAPVSDMTPISRGMIYRGLTLAHEGLDDEANVRRTLVLWYTVSGPDWNLIAEVKRLSLKFPSVRTIPEFQTHLAALYS